MIAELSLVGAVGVALLAIVGFVVLAVLLMKAGRRERARRPIPYPGCVACQVAELDDEAADTGRLGYLGIHQEREHTGGVRW